MAVPSKLRPFLARPGFKRLCWPQLSTHARTDVARNSRKATLLVLLTFSISLLHYYIPSFLYLSCIVCNTFSLSFSTYAFATLTPFSFYFLFLFLLTPPSLSFYTFNFSTLAFTLFFLSPSNILSILSIVSIFLSLFNTETHPHSLSLPPFNLVVNIDKNSKTIKLWRFPELNTFNFYFRKSEITPFGKSETISKDVTWRRRRFVKDCSNVTTEFWLIWLLSCHHHHHR